MRYTLMWWCVAHRHAHLFSERRNVFVFDQRFLDELIARSDIVDVVSGYVALQRKGGNLFGLCPFHNEKTPSFSVSPDKQIYHCFGCKKGGGVINFIMEIENLTFPEAVRFLAKRANLPVPEEEERSDADKLRRRVLELNRDAARWYYDLLCSPEGKAVQSYLDRRQIRGIGIIDVQQLFGMGAVQFDSDIEIVIHLEPWQRAMLPPAPRCSRSDFLHYKRGRCIVQRPLFAESVVLQRDAGQSAAARHHFFTRFRRCGRPSG